MSDFPTNIPTPLFVHTFTRWGGVADLAKMAAGVGVATITWPVANTAFYVPVAIPWPYPVRRVFWFVGSANTATNMDFGIYNFDGTRIYSTGSIAESTTSAPQYTTPSPDFILAPGRYYFALACSTTTASCGGQGNTGTFSVLRLRMGGVLQQASALALPATMTPASVSNACVPLCGVTRTSSGF